MVTLTFQVAVFLLLAVFGFHALGVAKALPASSRYRAGWMLTGVTFALYAANGLVQSGLAIIAFQLGPDAAVYRFFLSVSPIANHSRSFMIFGLYFALAALLWNPQPQRSRLILLALLPVALMGVGAGYGMMEGNFDRARHYSATAVLDTVGFIVMGSLLFASMLRDTLDRLLWFSLAMNGFRSIIGVIFLSAMAWLGVPGAWSPPNWLLSATRVLFCLAMVALAYSRYRLARKGKPVPGMLQNAPAPGVMAGLSR
jgi:hypothetical protein